MKKVSLTENKLRKIVKESIRNILQEVWGWQLEEDDVDWANKQSEGTKPFMVRIWPGSGYFLPAFGAWANSESDALEIVVAYLEKSEQNGFLEDKYVEVYKEELRADGLDDEEIDEEVGKDFFYVDATLHGASEPHYVRLENLSVYPFEKTKFAI